MRLDTDKLEFLCRERGTSLGEGLQAAGVSRNAYYTLARKSSVLPGSIERLAKTMGVPASSLLTDEPAIPAFAKRLVRAIDEVARDHPEMDRDHIRHVLILLDEPPIERLRGALRRGRA
jgi:transcriptional regulator with XRE-family HTH domain